MNRVNEILLLPALLVAGPCHAVDTPYPLITYQCDQNADVLIVTNSLLKADEGATFKYSADEGTYSPWDMVDIARQSDSTRIVRSRTVVNNCRLSSGEYTVTLEPQIFSRDLQGRCGAAISGAVRVEHGDTELLQRTAFEDYCHGNAPIITMVKVFGKTKDFRIERIPKYKFY